MKMMEVHVMGGKQAYRRSTSYIFGESYGRGSDLQYYGPILSRLTEEYTELRVVVPRRSPQRSVSGVRFDPLLAFWRLPLPSKGSAALSYGRRYFNLPTLGTFFRMLRRPIKAGISIEFTGVAALGVIATRLRGGRSYILIESDPAYRGVSPGVLGVLYKRMVIAFAHKVVANGPAAARYARTVLGVGEAKTLLLMYLTSAPGTGRAGSADGSGPIKLLFANSLTERKGIAQVLEAFIALPDDLRRKSRLTIVGDGPLQDELHQRVRGLDGIDIRWAGRLNHDELEEYYADSDVVLAPSMGDYRSLAAIEGVASGRPTVVSCLDGAHEELVGNGAYVVDPTQPGEIERALSLILGDEDLRRRLGREASVASERYSYGSIIANWRVMLDGSDAITE